MKYTVDYFLEEIYSLEALGMLTDLAVSPGLFKYFTTFEKKDSQKAMNYITSVLDECYKSGYLRIATFHNNQDLYGYAMLFVHPAPNFPKYLHKIYIKEKYRRNGIGKQILTTLLKDDSKISLLCTLENIPFYEKHGFQVAQSFKVPENENFLLSKGLYSELYVMSNYNEKLDPPIFLLNDNDIKKIICL